MILLYRETDPVTLIIEECYYDPETDRLSFKRLQDVGAALEANKDMFSMHNARPDYSDSNGMHLVARIPMVIVEKWKAEGFDWFKSTDNERRAWLDKPDNAFLKVRPGKLGGYRQKPLQSKVN